MKPLTLIIGASDNPERYSYKAAHALTAKGHPIKLLGAKQFELLDELALTGFHPLKNIDTVTLYIRPSLQPDYYDYILSLKPRRVIFNPGTENLEFEKLLQFNNIEIEIACTLVMLSIGTY